VGDSLCRVASSAEANHDCPHVMRQRLPFTIEAGKLLMNQLTLSPGQVQQLDEGATLVECREPAGRLVGYLHVAGRNQPVPVPDFSPEQLAQYEREPGGRSLGEILSDLRKRR